MREDKDNSAKWLIEHHGGAILRLSGIRGFTSWRGRRNRNQYNDRSLLSLFEGGRPMPWLSQIPYVQELIQEAAEERAHELADQRVNELVDQRVNERSRGDFQTAVLEILRDKFTEVPEELAVKVRAIQDVQQLRQLSPVAARCSDLDAFRASLPS